MAEASTSRHTLDSPYGSSAITGAIDSIYRAPSLYVAPIYPESRVAPIRVLDEASVRKMNIEGLKKLGLGRRGTGEISLEIM